MISKILLGAALAATSTSLYDDGWPPLQYRGDLQTQVLFTSDIDAACGKAPAGMVKLACAKGGRLIVLPNPCTSPAYANEDYARRVCHEMGHINGWPGDHPR